MYSNNGGKKRCNHDVFVALKQHGLGMCRVTCREKTGPDVVPVGGFDGDGREFSISCSFGHKRSNLSF